MNGLAVLHPFGQYTVFQSYQDDERVNVKCCLQCSAV